MIRAVRTMFKCHVILFVGEKEQSVVEYIEKGGYELNYPEEFYMRVHAVRKHEVGAVTGFGTMGTCFIYLRHLHDMPVFAHEISHAAFAILERAGVPHTRDTEEVYAYLQEYIMDGLLDKENTKKE